MYVLYIHVISIYNIYKVRLFTNSNAFDSNTLCLSSWWRDQMETFSALLAHCASNSPVAGEFPEQRPVTRRFDVLFELRLNKQFSKQSWGWWFETPSHPLWRHCNDERSTTTKRCLTVDVSVMISQCRCTIALSVVLLHCLSSDGGRFAWSFIGENW